MTPTAAESHYEDGRPVVLEAAITEALEDIHRRTINRDQKIGGIPMGFWSSFFNRPSSGRHAHTLPPSTVPGAPTAAEGNERSPHERLLNWVTNDAQTRRDRADAQASAEFWGDPGEQAAWDIERQDGEPDGATRARLANARVAYAGPSMTLEQFPAIEGTLVPRAGAVSSYDMDAAAMGRYDNHSYRNGDPGWNNAACDAMVSRAQADVEATDDSFEAYLEANPATRAEWGSEDGIR